MSSSTVDTTSQRPAAGREVSEREARQVAEAARETEWKNPSFVRELFLGRLRMDLIDPFPPPVKDDGERGEEFLRKLEAYLRTVDSAWLDQQEDIPDEVLAPLREMGAFGIKIPQEYGGLGLSQRTYNRAVALCASHGTTLGTLLSAHQSIGVPQPLVLFGTPEQKQKYLPRVAKGAISAFALTETGVGSDPARMSCTAEPTEDGSAYILNGEKLWCTNGSVADLYVVMARTPAPDGGRPKISAFIVERSWPGVEVTNRCSFMGLQGIKNCALRFTNVRIPKENLLWGEGRGLKLALITLNTGRLGIPWTCAAAGKWSLRVAREWAAERRQWGLPIGQHEAVAQKIGKMAADTFAMQAIAELCSALADSGKFDIRLEVALAKLYNSETGWRIVDDTVQIRGGRGYETAESLKARGEAPIPVERSLRNMRINRIFEGSSEIMRLFIAREAVDPHLQKAGAVADADAGIAAKAKDSVGLVAHMASWLGGTLVSGGGTDASKYGDLADHVRYAERSAKRLARTMGMAMARFGPTLERRQAVLFRMVDIGAELFAMSASVAFATRLINENPSNRSPIRLADLFCRHARDRIEVLFDNVFNENDKVTYDLAQDVVKGDFAWLESGIIEPPSPTVGGN